MAQVPPVNDEGLGGATAAFVACSSPASIFWPLWSAALRYDLGFAAGWCSYFSRILPERLQSSPGR